MKKIIGLDALYVVLIILVIAGNFFLQGLFLKLDFSKGRAYTLSPSTRKVVSRLDKTATVTFYVTSALPSQLAPYKRQVDDLLGEYRSDGHGKVSIVVKDPSKDQKTAQEAQSYGVPSLQFSQQEKNKYAVSTAYFGIGLSYDNKKTTVQKVVDISNLEYDLTSSLYKLSTKELPKIGMIGTDVISNQLQSLQQAAANQFLLTSSASPEASMKAIVVFDSDSKEYSTEEAMLIQKYVDQGGKALVFVDGIWINADQQLSTQKAGHNLSSLLKHWGITLRENFILSTSAQLINYTPRNSESQMQLLAPYPFWIKTNNFRSGTSFFSNINQVVFPWVSSLSLTKTTGYSPEPLITTPAQSWELAGSVNLSPEAIVEPKQSDLSSFNLAASSKAVSGGGEVVVIPSSRFVQDQFIPRDQSNLGVTLNILSEFASGGALSGIRQRAVDMYYIPDLSDSQKDLFKYTNIFLLPLLAALYGVWRLTKRGRSSK
jgi:ABC-type uncharacterized transport system involved in gliding motility auxiliary subunit